MTVWEQIKKLTKNEIKRQHQRIKDWQLERRIQKEIEIEERRRLNDIRKEERARERGRIDAQIEAGIYDED